MNGINQPDILILSIVLFAVIICLLTSLSRIGAFRQNLRYVNTEIYRTSGREQLHWMRKRRELWLSLLPFVRFNPNK